MAGGGPRGGPNRATQCEFVGPRRVMRSVCQDPSAADGMNDPLGSSRGRQWATAGEIALPSMREWASSQSAASSEWPG